MKEKPILFSTPMVQAILAGRKTMTRRVIKLPHNMGGRPVGEVNNNENPLGFMYPCGIKRPPYQPGDILWVRETWQKECNVCEVQECADCGSCEDYFYKADYSKDYKNPWKPSIFMPRKAARIFLKVTNVRVERLQDITEEDARAEGITTQFLDIIAYSDDPKYQKFYDPENPDICRLQFEILWDSLNLKRGYGWDINPWVWIIEFERVEVPNG